MQSKILSSQKLLIVVLIGGILSVAFYFSFIQQNSIQSSSIPLTANTPLLSGQTRSLLPVRFKIPRINVDVAVEYVGLTSDGAMDVPSGPAEVAWYKLGPRPGEKGSAVIAGHSGWKNGKSAVFDNLYKLKKGDKIYVEDENGATTTFVVRESRKYDPKADASDVFGSSDGRAHLNLITCIGVWNKAEKSYAQRLVVFSDEEIK